MLFMSIASLSNASLCRFLAFLFMSILCRFLAFLFMSIALPVNICPCHFRSVQSRACPLQFHCFLCLALARLNYSFLCPSLSYPFFTLLFYSFALLFNALPLPFMSKPLQIKSFRCLSFANHYFAVHCLAVPLRTDSFLRHCYVFSGNFFAPLFLCCVTIFRM